MRALQSNIRSSLTRIDELSIDFDYAGGVTLEDSERILDRIVALHERVLAAVDTGANPERAASLRSFALTLERYFYGFEPDFFQQSVIRIVDDVISQFKGSLEIWPTLVEITYPQKKRSGLPLLRVANPPALPRVPRGLKPRGSPCSCRTPSLQLARRGASGASGGSRRRRPGREA